MGSLVTAIRPAPAGRQLRVLNEKLGSEGAEATVMERRENHRRHRESREANDELVMDV